jgi:arylsulfatase A-like enzyme
MGTISCKFTLYQGGLRIPYCMKWDGHIPAGSTCSALLENVDFLPTLCAAVGVDVPDSMQQDGINRWEQLRGVAADEREDMYFEWGHTRAVRTKKWKYIAWRHTPEEIEKMQRGEVTQAPNMHGHVAGDYAMHMQPHYFDVDQLYDLESDPTEQCNLVDDPRCADVLAEMRGRLKKYLARFPEPFDIDTVDPFVKSEAYRELVQKSMDDQRIYEAYFYKEKAY